MNTPLSLVQELRGIRGGQKHSQADVEALLSEIHEARREWQEQVDQAQHLLRELLSAISELSGVELPGISIDPQKDGDGALRLGFKTLKDRIRNELEAFASTSANEVSKQFEGRSQIVLDPLEKEMSARMDNLADEFRGKLEQRLRSEQDEVADQAKLRIEEMLQSKMGEFAEWIKLMTDGSSSSVQASVEKALELHLAEVKGRLKASLQQELGMVLVEMERTGQNRLEGIQKEVQSMMNDLPERARQACSASTDQAMKDLNRHLGSARQEFASQFEAGARAQAEESLNHFKAQLIGLSTSSREELNAYADSHVEGFKQRLESTAVDLQGKSVADIMGKVNKATKDALSVSLAHVQQRLDETLQHSEGQLKASTGTLLDEVRKQINDHLGIVSQEAAKKFEAATQAHTEGGLDHFKAHLHELSASTKEEFRSFADSHVSGFKQNLETMTLELLDRSAADIMNKVSKASQDALKASLAQVQQRLDKTLEHSKVELRSSMAGMLEDERKQISEAAQSARDSISGESARISDNLRSIGEKMNAAENERLAALSDNLAKLSQQSLDGHSRTLKEVAELELQEVRETLGGLQAQMISEYETQLRRSMESHRKVMMDQVQRQAEEASTNAIEKIKASSGQVVEDLSGKVNKEVNTATTLLNQWAHQTTVWAESSIKESLESYKRQVAEFTDALLDEQRTTIQRRIGDLQGRLEQAARLLRVSDVGAAASTHENEPQHV